MFTAVARPKKRLAVDTSGLYVRGEENLKGWRPRSPTIIDEHQAQLEKLLRIQEVASKRQYRLKYRRRTLPSRFCCSFFVLSKIYPLHFRQFCKTCTRRFGGMGEGKGGAGGSSPSRSMMAYHAAVWRHALPEQKGLLNLPCFWGNTW